jgi:hypothetical protein
MSTAAEQANAEAAAAAPSVSTAAPEGSAVLVRDQASVIIIARGTIQASVSIIARSTSATVASIAAEQASASIVANAAAARTVLLRLKPHHDV